MDILFGIAHLGLTPGLRDALWLVRHTGRGSILIVMLPRGDKSTQAGDIKRAQRILKLLESEDSIPF